MRRVRRKLRVMLRGTGETLMRVIRLFDGQDLCIVGGLALTEVALVKIDPSLTLPSLFGGLVLLGAGIARHVQGGR